MGSREFLLCVVLVICGCKDRSAQEKPEASTGKTVQASDAQVLDETSAGEFLEPVRIQQVQLNGALDDANRYPFSVLVEAYASSAEDGTLKCSGVLIAPRVVLTAGHCVCVPHEEVADAGGGHVIVDRSICASRATVTTMVYQPPGQGEHPRAVHERHHGEIRAHPELKLVLDERGSATTVHANLAVIVLDEALPKLFPPVRLTESDTQPHETLVTVGYGSRPGLPELFGQRRFNKRRVVKLSAEHEQILLEPSSRPSYENDSGGPCLRETPQGDVLAGISNRGLGSEPLCMNIYFHREWLRQEILGVPGLK